MITFPLSDDYFSGARRITEGTLPQILNQLNASVFSNTTRPDAATVPMGSGIWNSDDKAPNYSDGTNWRDAAGNLT